MDFITYNNFTTEEAKPIFTTACVSKTTTTTESFSTAAAPSMANPPEATFSPLAPPFQARGGNELLNLLAQQEPKPADTAPITTGLEDMLLNLRMNGSELLFDEVDHNNTQNYFMGNKRPEPENASNLWNDNASIPAGPRNGEMLDTFDFLIKSLSSANNYVSMLTREQLSVLRSIRPSLLYEFLLEVAKVRSDKRMRRALPNECAFCKNNGENEECYSSHALKDWRGRVTCPVLRAFRCPRCGATGDRAHTIKYCPDNVDAGSERSGITSRRRMPPSASLVLGRVAPSPAPSSPSPATTLPHSTMWSTFGMN
ncbi:hypothetical protein ACJJTC_001743 [Scirpophaga incertulas]